MPTMQRMLSRSALLALAFPLAGALHAQQQPLVQVREAGAGEDEAPCALAAQQLVGRVEGGEVPVAVRQEPDHGLKRT